MLRAKRKPRKLRYFDHNYADNLTRRLHRAPYSPKQEDFPTSSSVENLSYG